MAMNATTPGTPPDLHGALVNIQNSFGVVLIGSAASTGLLGVTTLQAWFYFRSYPEDNLLTKLMVSVVWCIEFIRSSFLVRAAYFYLVLNWGNIAVLNENNWSINILPLMTNLGELFGHLYFAWRIYTLARVPVVRWILTGLVATLSVWNFGMGTATYVITSRAASLTSFGNSGSQKILSPFALATAISTDVAIMVSLIFLLNRGRTGLSRTDHLINMLIYYTVQAGMITVVADVVIIILNHYIDRVGFTYLGPYAIVGNLYANSFLASLNARTSLRAHNGGTISVSTTPGTWKAAGPSSTALGGTETTIGGSRAEAYEVQMTRSFDDPKESGEVKAIPLYELNNKASFSR